MTSNLSFGFLNPAHQFAFQVGLAEFHFHFQFAPRVHGLWLRCPPMSAGHKLPARACRADSSSGRSGIKFSWNEVILAIVFLSISIIYPSHCRAAQQRESQSTPAPEYKARTRRNPARTSRATRQKWRSQRTPSLSRRAGQRCQSQEQSMPHKKFRRRFRNRKLFEIIIVREARHFRLRRFELCVRSLKSSRPGSEQRMFATVVCTAARQ